MEKSYRVKLVIDECPRGLSMVGVVEGRWERGGDGGVWSHPEQRGRNADEINDPIKQSFRVKFFRSELSSEHLPAAHPACQPLTHRCDPAQMRVETGRQVSLSPA